MEIGPVNRVNIANTQMWGYLLMANSLATSFDEPRTELYDFPVGIVSAVIGVDLDIDSGEFNEGYSEGDVVAKVRKERPGLFERRHILDLRV
tara:strand:- start:2375 stop:2650 length:276 start_codon:yes stop_codon:yes gene_type:complete